MHSNPTDQFQTKVASLLVRNSNILDILTKCQICCARLCRSTIKAATGCGCTRITAEKALSQYSEPLRPSATEMAGTDGSICSDCRSSIENEIGEMLFYVASLCNALDISMADIMKREIKNVEALGKYSLR